MSPSGKAPDFDSGIRRFESCHPSHVGARRALLRFFPRLGAFAAANRGKKQPACAAVASLSVAVGKTSPCCRPGMENVNNDPLAQLAEQLPFKQWVWSSNLQRVTIAILNKALEKSSFSGVLLSLCICLRGSKNVTKRCFNKPNKKPPKMEKASS